MVIGPVAILGFGPVGGLMGPVDLRWSDEAIGPVDLRWSEGGHWAHCNWNLHLPGRGGLAPNLVPFVLHNNE